MVDNIWKLKFCPKKGAECYFREFDALSEAALTMCDYEVPIEICSQKATCAILIAQLLWNVTKKANLEWWNRMGFIEREDVWDAFKCHWTCRLQKIKVDNNTKDLTNNEAGYKRGDENEDDTDLLFPDNDDDSNIYKDEKVNDGRDEIKAPHGWNKACKRCADKKIDLEDETPEQSLERIAAFHNTTVQQLLKEKKILKDDNPEILPPIKIERIRRNTGNYKEVSSDDGSNENGKAEEDTVNGKDGEESQEERNEHTEEEDRENEEGADPLAVATNQELQKGNMENVEEKAENRTDASEKNEREEKQKT
eukprot:jgi/Psemu1/37403/gm1.37403_g